jgi:hypothetical protein
VKRAKDCAPAFMKAKWLWGECTGREGWVPRDLFVEPFVVLIWISEESGWW